MKKIILNSIFFVAFQTTTALATTITCPVVAICDGKTAASCQVASDLYQTPYTYDNYQPGAYQFYAAKIDEDILGNSDLFCRYKHNGIVINFRTIDALQIDFSTLDNKPEWHWEINRGGTHEGICYDTSENCAITLR